MEHIIIKKLLKKKMERKEFLLYLGLFLLAFTGISNFLKTITDTISAEGHTSISQGFGSSVYGGEPQKGNNLIG